MKLTSRSIEQSQPTRQNLENSETKRIKQTKKKTIIAKTLEAFNLKAMYDSFKILINSRKNLERDESATKSR